MAGRASGPRRGGCLFLMLVLLGMGGLAVTQAPQYLARVWPGIAAVVQAASEPAAAEQPVSRLQPAQRDSLVAAADEAWEQGDWARAADSLTALAAAEPQWAERLCQARVNLGHALLGEARLQEAAAQFDLALKARPESADALAGRELVANLDAPSEVEAPREAEAPAPASAPAAAPAAASVPVVASASSAAQVTVSHVVQRGENLFRLAMRFGTTVPAIEAANGLVSDRIIVGQRLIIPACPSKVVVAATVCPVTGRVIVQEVSPAPVVVCPTVCPPVRVVVPVCPRVVVPVCPQVVVPVCPQVVVPVCPQVVVPVCDP